MQAVATLDGFPLPFNPNSVDWGYQLNTSSYETLGGRVVQILSAKISSLEFQAEAGSAANLTSIAEKVMRIMQFHVDTQRPVRFEVPIRGWVLSVYVTTMPAIGYALDTVTFPYQLTMEVYEDFNTVAPRIMEQELARLSEGIGYDPLVHGGDIENASNPTETQPPTEPDPTPDPPPPPPPGQPTGRRMEQQ